MTHHGLDHLALAVRDTDEALRVWRDRLGFPVVHQETVNGGTTLLTHLDLGNTHLQLVQPLVPDHPLHAWLDVHGEGLHHLCLAVENVDDVESPRPPHQGIRGKRARFLDPSATGGVQVEVTGA